MSTSALRALAVGSVLAGVALTGCRSATHGTPSTPPASASGAPSSTPTTASPKAPSPATSPSVGRGDGSRPVPVNKTITDAALASSLTVAAEVRHLPGPNDGQEVVALKVTINNGVKYTSGISTLALKVTESGGETGLPMADDPSYAAMLKRHGLGPVLAEDPRRGEARTGWVPFLFMNTDQAQHLVFEYQRDKIDVLGTSRSIPARTFAVRLPA